MIHVVLACTTFCLSGGGHHLIGKSYDWDMEQALVITNPRGLHKRALLRGAGKPAECLVAPIGGKVHYMACDRTGACATFENIGGKMVVNGGRQLTSKVLTNDTYRASVDALAGHQGFGGKRAIPSGKGSLDRFVRAASLVAAGKPDRKVALAVLDSVRQGSYSKWNVIYDPITLRITFRTASRPALKEIDLKALATDCKSAARMLDMATAAKGDVTAKFASYSFAANKKLVETSLAPVAASLPRGAAWVVAGYPATTRCRAH